jgi:hypothetical protein
MKQQAPPRVGPLVTLLASATAEVITTGTFPEGTRRDAMASELASSRR